MHLFTIGHSNRSAEDFLALLMQHGITRVADVRRTPRSRYNPQFNDHTLATFLAGRGIDYIHIPDLGGMRTATPDSPNTAFRTQGGFQGYADYLQTPAFETGMARLLHSDHRTAYMCAEREPTQCHRSILSDVLVVRGHRVTHIVRDTDCYDHVLRDFAVVVGGVPTYPARPAAQLALF